MQPVMTLDFPTLFLPTSLTADGTGVDSTTLLALWPIINTILGQTRPDDTRSIKHSPPLAGCVGLCQRAKDLHRTYLSEDKIHRREKRAQKRRARKANQADVVDSLSPSKQGSHHDTEAEVGPSLISTNTTPLSPRECAICMIELQGSTANALVPCGHACYCDKCCVLLSECALCQHPIIGRLTVFL